MTAAASFRQLIETLPQPPVQQAIHKTFIEEDQADRERMVQNLDQSDSKSSPISDSQRGRNYDLNRYCNVIPFNHNRVRLQGKNDYINASHIQLPAELSANKYIATQGPLNHSTGDFWQMTWEQGALAIIMLANPVEGRRNKCATYWPASTGQQIKAGDLTVTLADERPMQDCFAVIVRKITLAHKLHPGVTRTVTQLHYTEWPDHGVPQSPLPMLRMMQELRSDISPNPEIPVIVHCSAGVGRTGTFIIIDSALAYFAKNSDYEGDYVQDAFKSLRKQRSLMVQVLEQYMLCYQVIGYTLNNKQ
ncbi:hypothetical protein LPJ66_006803 [Kickxella alabastrina]|uniref:Uncharacterized protein n=1 Tax=Kickxella alabastrina TaxID=61397 RepID=A0ACC1IB93_9FUNG|nr:hypothetical protein LPJ66_006803 [Kickxella alabastrina]